MSVLFSIEYKLYDSREFVYLVHHFIFSESAGTLWIFNKYFFERTNESIKSNFFQIFLFFPQYFYFLILSCSFTLFLFYISPFCFNHSFVVILRCFINRSYLGTDFFFFQLGLSAESLLWWIVPLCTRCAHSIENLSSMKVIYYVGFLCALSCASVLTTQFYIFFSRGLAVSLFLRLGFCFQM